MLRTFRVSLIWLACGLLAASFQAESASVVEQAPGPYSVGFRVVQQYDRSREQSQEDVRFLAKTPRENGAVSYGMRLERSSPEKKKP